MPHKVAVIAFLDDVSTAVKVAGSCNAVRRDDDGRSDRRHVRRRGLRPRRGARGRSLAGKRVLVVGSGGVGSAIAASSAAAGAAEIALYDVNASRDGGAARAALRRTIRISRFRSDRTTRRVRRRRQRDAARHEGRRSDAGRRLAPFALDLCRRSGDEAGDDGLSRRGAGARLRDADRDRHAVRADPSLPRILRLPVGRRRRSCERSREIDY